MRYGRISYIETVLQFPERHDPHVDNFLFEDFGGDFYIRFYLPTLSSCATSCTAMARRAVFFTNCILIYVAVPINHLITSEKLKNTSILLPRPLKLDVTKHGDTHVPTFAYGECLKD